MIYSLNHDNEPQLHGKEKILHIFRLRTIDIRNLGAVEKGTVKFPCLFSESEGFSSEIVGIYGQNGTGKSTVLKSLEFLHSMFTDYDKNKTVLPNKNLITVGKKTAKLSFTFDIYDYTGSALIGSYFYQFSFQANLTGQNTLYKVVGEKIKISLLGQNTVEFYLGNRTPIEDIKGIVDFLNESGDVDFSKHLTSILLEARDKSNLHCNSFFLNAISSHLTEIVKWKEEGLITSAGTDFCSIIQDFITFAGYMYISSLNINDLRNSDNLIFSLPIKNTTGDQLFYRYNVSIVDTERLPGDKYLDFLENNRIIQDELYGHDEVDNMEKSIKKMLSVSGIPNIVRFSYPEFFSFDTVFDDFSRQIKLISEVLNTIFPDIRLEIERGQNIYLYAVHDDGTKISLNKESYGVKKIFMLIRYLRQFFNEPSYLMVIDEFDEGLFEYTFSTLLTSLRNDGKGQMIFSAHNLRALENLAKESICFSTPNPSDRFVTMKNVKPTNNLRDLYLRRIYLNEGGQKLYSGSSESTIAYALEMLGGDYAND